MIFDRSRSIWESYDGQDWRTVLSFFRLLVGGNEIDKDGVNFALATFSEDYIIHAGFNYSYNKGNLLALATYNNSAPGAETWIPHDVLGGKDLRFEQTNYGLVVDILEDAYNDKTFGARDDARPLVFLVTDGSMDDQMSGIYDLNRCPTNRSALVCGFEKREQDAYNASACKECWRGDLARRLNTVRVKDSVSVIGIGKENSTSNRPDDLTLKVFAQNDADRLIRT